MAEEIGVQSHHANQIEWGFSDRFIQVLGSEIVSLEARACNHDHDHE